MYKIASIENFSELVTWFNRYFHLSVDGKFKGLAYALDILGPDYFCRWWNRFYNILKRRSGKFDVIRMSFHGHKFNVYVF